MRDCKVDLVQRFRNNGSLMVCGNKYCFVVTSFIILAVAISSEAL